MPSRHAVMERSRCVVDCTYVRIGKRLTFRMTLKTGSIGDEAMSDEAMNDERH